MADSGADVRHDFESMARRLNAMGCTPEEVAAVERDVGKELPRDYRLFLETMGRDGGGLFGGSDLVYPEMLGLYGAAIELLEEDGNPFSLPADAVVFRCTRATSSCTSRARTERSGCGSKGMTAQPRLPTRCWTSSSTMNVREPCRLPSTSRIGGPLRLPVACDSPSQLVLGAVAG